MIGTMNHINAKCSNTFQDNPSILALSIPGDDRNSFKAKQYMRGYRKFLRGGPTLTTFFYVDERRRVQIPLKAGHHR